MGKPIKFFFFTLFFFGLFLGPYSWGLPIDLVGNDGIITGEDILEFIKSWHTTPQNPNWNPSADVNNDNHIDANDFLELAELYEHKIPVETPTLTPTIVIPHFNQNSKTYQHSHFHSSTFP